jgi:hypothetical protein
LVVSAVACGILQILVTMVPSGLSCLFRVNCDNDDVVPSILTQGFQPMANPFATTVMPLGFRFQLAGIMLGNMLTVCCWAVLLYRYPTELPFLLLGLGVDYMFVISHNVDEDFDVEVPVLIGQLMAVPVSCYWGLQNGEHQLCQLQ